MIISINAEKHLMSSTSLHDKKKSSQQNKYKRNITPNNEGYICQNYCEHHTKRGKVKIFPRGSGTKEDSHFYHIYSEQLGK
jgi:hypothetical protein